MSLLFTVKKDILCYVLNFPFKRTLISYSRVHYMYSMFFRNKLFNQKFNLFKLKKIVKLFHGLWLDLLDGETSGLRTPRRMFSCYWSSCDESWIIFIICCCQCWPGEQEAVHSVHDTIAGRLVTSDEKTRLLQGSVMWFWQDRHKHIITLPALHGYGTLSLF